MPEAIGRVLEAAHRSTPDEIWVKSTERISDERRDIDEMLRAYPNLRVYGFNTLLGQQDNVASVASNQDLVLKSHMIGRASRISGVLPDLILSTKLEQLSHGGSGLHPDTYQAILDSFLGHSAEVLGAWRDSYSSGDVVPAAWWLNHLRTHNERLALRSGDLIALINGNFISTAFALNSTVRLITYCARFLAKAIELVQPGRVGVLARGGDWLAELVDDDLPIDSHIYRAGANLQAPVSMRDIATYVGPMWTTLAALRNAIDHRLGSFSGNPTFYYSHGAIRHASQASFLDLNLSLALTSSIQLVHFCMGAMQRFIQHICDTRKQGYPLDYVRFVQPPKIASVLLAEADYKHGTLPTKFNFAESEGIEDQADLSLSIAQSLDELVILANDQAAILDDVFALMGRRPHDRGPHYARALLSWFTGVDDAGLVHDFTG